MNEVVDSGSSLALQWTVSNRSLFVFRAFPSTTMFNTKRFPESINIIFSFKRIKKCWMFNDWMMLCSKSEYDASQNPISLKYMCPRCCNDNIEILEPTQRFTVTILKIEWEERELFTSEYWWSLQGGSKHTQRIPESERLRVTPRNLASIFQNIFLRSCKRNCENRPRGTLVIHISPCLTTSRRGFEPNASPHS